MLGKHFGIMKAQRLSKAQKAWEEGFSATAEFVQTNHRLPADNAQSRDEAKAKSWLVKQKIRRQTGELSDELFERARCIDPLVAAYMAEEADSWESLLLETARHIEAKTGTNTIGEKP